MSTLRIGRCVIDKCIGSLTMAGDRVSITGTFDGDSLAHGKIIRQQLLGLVDNDDEPVVPLVSDLDPDLDGFYRVVSASCAPRRGRAYSATSIGGRHDYDVQLERVSGGYANPSIEIPYVTASRPTSPSAVTHLPRLGLPAAALQVGGVTALVAGDRDNDDGSSTELFTIPATGVATMVLPTPASALTGGCRIEVGGYPVIGRQLPTPDASTITMSNGFFRMRFVGSAGAATSVAWDVYDGATWDAVSSATLDVDTNPTSSTTWRDVVLVEPIILVNSAALVAVRFAIETKGGTSTLTFSLRRGAPFIAVDASNPQGGEPLGLKLTMANLSTAITGGRHQTANGATGHRWVFASAHAFTVSSFDITWVDGGGVQLARPFALGVEFTGTSAAGINTAAACIAEWWALMSTAVNVVSR